MTELVKNGLIVRSSLEGSGNNQVVTVAAKDGDLEAPVFQVRARTAPDYWYGHSVAIATPPAATLAAEQRHYNEVYPHSPNLSNKVIVAFGRTGDRFELHRQIPGDKARGFAVLKPGETVEHDIEDLKVGVRTQEFPRGLTFTMRGQEDVKVITIPQNLEPYAGVWQPGNEYLPPKYDLAKWIDFRIDKITPDNHPKLVTEKERGLINETAETLNEHYRKGGWVWEKGAMRLLRKLPRPICVDFDRTLITYLKGSGPNGKDWRYYTPDPYALDSLEKLQEIGSVVILTGNNDNWERRREAMEDMGIWLPGMVMIDADNYRAEYSLARSRGVADNEVSVFGKGANKKDLRDYRRLERMKQREADKYYQIRRGNAFSEFNGMWQPKNIVSALDKQYDVPMIDDTPWVTEIPGMHGITVRALNWDSPSTGKYDEYYSSTSLTDAVKQVRDYYTSIS
jgi:hypothetical protein